MFLFENTQKRPARKSIVRNIPAHIVSAIAPCIARISICPAVALLGLLMVLMLPGGNAHASLACNACHTMPPTDAPAGNRDPSTGGFKGNHAGHSGASVNSCTACHGAGVTTYAAAHSTEMLSAKNGPIIKLTPKIHNYSTINGSARYSRGTFFNQTSVPPDPLGTCSNVNCHFESTTPAWGSANFTSPADCDKCHGAPPSGGSSGAAGSHARHDQYYPGTTNCLKCHPNNTTFKHATSAGSRNLAISFAAAPNNGSGAYSGPLNDYLPSQTNTFGNCTVTYCHSNGKIALGNFSTNIVPTWGGAPMPANCTGCHRADNAGGMIIKSGSHARHLDPASLYSFKCIKCHAATVNGSMTIVDTASHVNGKVNIKFDSLTTAVGGTYGGQATPYAKDPGTAYGQCNNVYCHSNGQNDGGVGITYIPPTWGTTSRCGTCHDVNASHSFSGSEIATGSHTKHLSSLSYSSPTKCIVCHNVGGLAFDGSCNNTCHSAATKHVDGKIDINFPVLFGASAQYDGSSTPGSGYNTCSNVSCHYNTTTPAWGTATPFNCFGCHSLAVLMASGAHSKHISNSLVPTMYNYTANSSTAGEYNFGCANCHPVSTAYHMNGSVNVTLKKNEVGIGSLRTKNSATAVGIGVANSGITGTTKVSIVCSAAYCHSNGNAAALVYAVTPNWYGGAFTGDKCANCHGNSPNSTIAGSKSHYNNKFLGYTSTSGGHQIGIHAMNIYSSPGGLAQAGTSGKSSHGNAAGSTTISCNICHYLTVTSPRNDDNVVCKTCHYAGNTVGAVAGNPAAVADKSKHVNGSVNIAFKPTAIISRAQIRPESFASAPYSSVWRRNAGYKISGSNDSAKTTLDTAGMWNSGTKTCSNIACHNGQSVKWSDNNGATSCASCHTAL